MVKCPWIAKNLFFLSNILCTYNRVIYILLSSEIFSDISILFPYQFFIFYMSHRGPSIWFKNIFCFIGWRHFLFIDSKKKIMTYFVCDFVKGVRFWLRGCTHCVKNCGIFWWFNFISPRFTPRFDWQGLIDMMNILSIESSTTTRIEHIFSLISATTRSFPNNKVLIKIQRFIVSRSNAIGARGLSSSLFVELPGRTRFEVTLMTPLPCEWSSIFCFLLLPRPSGNAKSCGSFRIILPDVISRPKPSSCANAYDDRSDRLDFLADGVRRITGFDCSAFFLLRLLIRIKSARHGWQSKT